LIILMDDCGKQVDNSTNTRPLYEIILVDFQCGGRD